MFFIIIMFQVNTGNSILSDLTKRELSKKIGHFGICISYKTSTAGMPLFQGGSELPQTFPFSLL